MGCNCNEVKKCKSTECTGCPIKDLYGNCVNLALGTLPCSGINADNTLDNVIQALDEFICSKIDNIANFITLINIGGGAELYAGDTVLGKKQMKTLISTDGTVTINPLTEAVDLTVKDSIVANTNTAVQPGDNVSVLNNDAGYLTSFSETDTLQSVTSRGNITTNNLIVKDTPQSITTIGLDSITNISGYGQRLFASWNTLNFSRSTNTTVEGFDVGYGLSVVTIPALQKTTLGFFVPKDTNNELLGNYYSLYLPADVSVPSDKVAVFNGRVEGSDAVDNNEFTTLSQVNTIVQGQVTPSIRKFIVNNLYTGTTEEGTIIKPYKTIDSAVNAYLGTGTPDAPEHQGSTIVIQKGNDYYYTGNFNYRDLSVTIEEGTLFVSNPSVGEFLMDLDTINGATNSDNNIIINKGATLEIRRSGFKNRGVDRTIETGTKLITMGGEGTLFGQFSTGVLFEQNYEDLPNHTNNVSGTDIILKDIDIRTNKAVYKIGGKSSISFNTVNCRCNNQGGGINHKFYKQVGGDIYKNKSTFTNLGDPIETVFHMEIRESALGDPYLRMDNCIIHNDSPTDYMITIENTSTTKTTMQPEIEMYQNKTLFSKFISVFNVTYPTIMTKILFKYNIIGTGNLCTKTTGTLDVDLTRDNTTSVTNNVGQNVVENLRVFTDRLTALANPSMEKGSKFFNETTDNIDIIP